MREIEIARTREEIEDAQWAAERRERERSARKQTAIFLGTEGDPLPGSSRHRGVDQRRAKNKRARASRKVNRRR